MLQRSAKAQDHYPQNQRSHPRSTVFLMASLLVAALGWAGDASAERGSIASNLLEWEESLQRTEELKQHLLLTPEDEQGWIELLDLLEGSAERNRHLAEFARRRDWEPQPGLHEDLKARQHDDLLRWTSAAVVAHPEIAEFHLRLLALQTDGRPSLDQVQELAKDRPDNVRLAFCAARGLAEEVGSEASAEYLTRFVAAHPDDPNAYQAQGVLLRTLNQPEAAFAAHREQVRRFPDEPLFRLQLMRFSEPEQRRSLLEELEGKATSTAEKVELCSSLLGDSTEDRGALDCSRRLWSRLKEGGTDPLEGAEGSWARTSFFNLAEVFEDEDWMMEILGTLRGDEAAGGWLSVLSGELGGPAACEGLLHAAATGVFEEPRLPPDQHLWDWITTWTDLADHLAGCGDLKTADHLRRTTIESLPTEKLASLFFSAGDPIAEEMLRRFAEAPRDEEILAILGRNSAEFPEVSRERVLRAWAEVSESVEPAFMLASLLRMEGRHDEEGEVLDLALMREPDNLDLQIRRAGAAFSTGHLELAAGLCQEVLRSRHGTVRQYATARYLLGRVARQQGRMEEASDHLERYFLQRFAYAGRCPRESDEGLLAHLWQTASPERVEAYVQAKAQALAAYLAAGEAGSLKNLVQLTCGFGPELATAPPSLLDQWNRLSPENPVDRNVQGRILTGRDTPRAHWKEQDPENLFHDDQVLEFDPAVVERDAWLGTGLICIFGSSEPGPFGILYNPYPGSCPW